MEQLDLGGPAEVSGGEMLCFYLQYPCFHLPNRPGVHVGDAIVEVAVSCQLQPCLYTLPARHSFNLSYRQIDGVSVIGASAEWFTDAILGLTGVLRVALARFLCFCCAALRT